MEKLLNTPENRYQMALFVTAYADANEHNETEETLDIIEEAIGCETDFSPVAIHLGIRIAVGNGLVIRNHGRHKGLRLSEKGRAFIEQSDEMHTVLL